MSCWPCSIATGTPREACWADGSTGSAITATSAHPMASILTRIDISVRHRPCTVSHEAAACRARGESDCPDPRQCLEHDAPRHFRLAGSPLLEDDRDLRHPKTVPDEKIAHLDLEAVAFGG